MVSAVVLAVGSAGCQSAETTKTGAPSFEGWNVVLVLVDSLRSRQLGAYGYERDTSPLIDRLAREGLVFENAQSNSSFTRESVSSLFTGRLPSRSGAIGWDASPPAGSPTLAERFQAAGYRTGLFSSSVMLGHERYRAGFDDVQFGGRSQFVSRSGPRLTRAALHFARAEPAQPFFLYLHYLDPHGPYEPPERLQRRLGASPHPSPLALYGDVREGATALKRAGFGPGDPRFDDLVARYDAEVAHTDESIGGLLLGLQEQGQLARTLVVITADHGEEFLEHGFVEHAWTLYQESLSVPLILWAPAALAPARVASRVSLVDVAPTLIELFGLGREGARDGSALLEAGPGGWRVRGAEAPVHAELMVQTRSLLRSVTHENWKYIAAYKWMEVPEREREVRRRRVTLAPPDLERVDPFGPVVREELYDLATDPGETHDLAGEAQERLSALRELMRRHVDAAASLAGQHPAPAPQVLSEDERLQLRALGYLQDGGTAASDEPGSGAEGADGAN